MVNESPWTTKDITLNLGVLISLVILASVMLILKAFWLFLALFWIDFILGFMIIGRYVTCRHCDYLGKPCPSWCMGIIGKWLGFQRSAKKNFCEDGGILFAVLFDISFLIIAMGLPIIAYSIEAFVKGLGIVDYLLLILYIGLVFATLGIHSLTGCRKCDIDCPLRGKKGN
ncbi:MAG: hypothetical protein ACTSRS_00385 [Candidatus Helarchaeota archaeon]